MIWANFLHFYQPPTQKKYWIDRITDEAYRRIIRGLLENPQAKITLNVNSVLCELWEKHGHDDVLKDLKTLVGRGQVELTGSAKFHPLLPKLPKEMIVRQIVLNEVTLNKYFGAVGPILKKHKIRNPKSETNSNVQNQKAQSVSNFDIRDSNLALRGFFPPEMAYNRYLAEIVADLGYEWIIAEELSLGKPVDYSKIYTVSGVSTRKAQKSEAAPDAAPQGETLWKPEMMIFFRDRTFSYKVLAGYLGTEKLFLDELKKRFPDSVGHFLLTAMDGETFGHHRPGMERLLFDLFRIPEIKMVHLSDLPELFSGRESVETKASTWALMEHEVERNLPFARWDDPENEVHKLQWELTNLAIAAVENSKLKNLNSKQIQSSKNQKLKDLEFNDLGLFRVLDLEFRISDPSEMGGSNLVEEQRKWLEAQFLLDRALHSDQYWWASAKPWWSIEYIERGAKELLGAVEALPDVESEKSEAKSLYYRILEAAFEYQRSGKVDEISRKEDETIRMRTDQTLPQMPKEELLKIIAAIRQEMREVAAKQEYERAAQLRDRIKELEGYLG